MLIQLLKDNSGNISSMRAAFLWLIFNGTVMAWVSLFLIGSAESIAVFASITGVAVTLKTIQKAQEKARGDERDPKNE